MLSSRSVPWQRGGAMEIALWAFGRYCSHARLESGENFWILIAWAPPLWAILCAFRLMVSSGTESSCVLYPLRRQTREYSRSTTRRCGGRQNRWQEPISPPLRPCFANSSKITSRSILSGLGRESSMSKCSPQAQRHLFLLM